jgi:hypothetical protein
VTVMVMDFVIGGFVKMGFDGGVFKNSDCVVVIFIFLFLDDPSADEGLGVNGVEATCDLDTSVLRHPVPALWRRPIRPIVCA